MDGSTVSGMRYPPYMYGSGTVVSDGMPSLISEPYPAGGSGEAWQPAMQPSLFEFTDGRGASVAIHEYKEASFSGGEAAVRVCLDGVELGVVREIDVDEAAGEFRVVGYTILLPREPAEAQRVAARLRAAAEHTGIPHNVRTRAPAAFDVALKYPGETLGLSFAVLQQGTVIVTAVMGHGPCARAGVVPGVIHTVDDHPVSNGSELAQVVQSVRQSNRRVFTLEVAPMTVLTEAQKAGLATATKPQASPTEQKSPPVVVLTVAFKYGRRGDYGSIEAHGIGSPVVVETQTGIDLGIVIGTRLPEVGGLPRVVRAATNRELARWKSRVKEDEVGLRFVQQQARLLNVAVALHRVEFQFDTPAATKATIHYSVPPGVTNTDVSSALAALSAKLKPLGTVAFNNCNPLPGGVGVPLDLKAPVLPNCWR